MTTKELQRQIMGELAQAEELQKYFLRVDLPVIGYGDRIWVYVNTCDNVFNDFIKQFIERHSGQVGGGYFREERKGGASIEFYIADLDKQAEKLILAEQTIKEIFALSALDRINVLSCGTWDGKHEVITIDFDGQAYSIKHWNSHAYSGNAPKNYICDISVYTKENGQDKFLYSKEIYKDNLLKAVA